MSKAVGYFLGRVVVGPVLMSVVILWIADKLTKKELFNKKNVAILALGLLILSALGTY